MKIIFLVALFASMQLSNLFAQETEPVHQHSHDHHRNEIGVANSIVYFVSEKEYAYGLHLHYVYNLPHSNFGFGLGYERIFDQHKHNTIGLVAVYRPIERLSFNVSPGIAFEDKSNTAKFALHLETAYEFEINNFHLGPAFEFAFDQEDIHLSFGIHLGYGF